MIAGELPHFGGKIEGTVGEDDFGFADATWIEEHLAGGWMASVVLIWQIEMVVAEGDPDAFAAPAHMDEFGSERQEAHESFASFWGGFALEFGLEGEGAGFDAELGHDSFLAFKWTTFRVGRGYTGLIIPGLATTGFCLLSSSA